MTLYILSTQQLRHLFKQKVEELMLLLEKDNTLNNIYLEIQKLSEHLEQVIQEKIKLLESDFNEQTLAGDYLLSVTESFDDLDRLLCSSKTFLDAVQGKNKNDVMHDIHRHHQNTLIPLLNILGKLENDYISVTTQGIAKKQEMLSKLETKLQSLKKEEQYIRNSMLIFNKKKKLSQFITQIRFLDLKRQMLKLTIHHDKLNLYYFNHDHPHELKELKQKTHRLRFELSKFKEIRYEHS